MPYFKKRNFKKRYPTRRRPKRFRKRSPFSKRQQSVVRSIALKAVNKTRELKQRNIAVDEYQTAFPGAGVITNNLTNSYVYNYIGEGDGYKQRVGNQIQPVSLRLKGWVKVNGNSNDAAYHECAVRIIAGFVDNDSLQDLESSLSTSRMFWNGNSTIPAGDYKDITRNLNWKFIRPIYDKKFTLAPATNLIDSGNGTSTTTSPNGIRDYKLLNISHKFGKMAELTLDSEHADCWQKQNLVIISFARTLNDDISLTSNVLEYCLEGNFYFHDS